MSKFNSQCYHLEVQHNSPSVIAMGFFSNMLIALLSCSVLFFTFCGERSLSHYLELSQDVELMQDKNRKILSSIYTVEQEIEAAKSSPYFLEKTAREDLALSSDDEIIYFFSE